MIVVNTLRKAQQSSRDIFPGVPYSRVITCFLEKNPQNPGAPNRSPLKQTWGCRIHGKIQNLAFSALASNRSTTFCIGSF